MVTDVAARLDDAIKRRSVHHEVAHNRKRSRPKWLDKDLGAVVERSHVQLTSGRLAARAMCLSVDHHRTASADALTAIVIECNRLCVFSGQFLIETIEHFQKRHIRSQPIKIMRLHVPFVIGRFLSPYVNLDFHDL